jgi:hypothetical protein
MPPATSGAKEILRVLSIGADATRENSSSCPLNALDTDDTTGDDSVNATSALRRPVMSRPTDLTDLSCIERLVDVADDGSAV